MQTFSGTEYTKINIANAFGHDKMLWDERIEWTEANEPDLLSLVADADKPMLMLKGIHALEAAQNGEPSGHLMDLDATASGLQIMAALVGCKETAKNTNLIFRGTREDVYRSVAQDMNVDRELIKKPVMTTFYGSLAQPKKVLAPKQLPLFYAALQHKLPGAIACMRAIQSKWDGNATEYVWTLPDLHTACQKVFLTVDKKIEVDEANHHTFTYRASINQAIPKGLSLAANIIHSIDGWIVREMIRRAFAQGFDLLSIHDCFWAHPNYMNQVRKNYQDIFVELAQMDLLGTILSEITGTVGTIKKYSTDLHLEIAKSEYHLS